MTSCGSQAQPLDDVGPDRGRRSRGQGHHGGVAEAFDDPAKMEVVGAEIVAPRWDAVSFVNHEQRWPCLAQLGDDLPLG